MQVVDLQRIAFKIKLACRISKSSCCLCIVCQSNYQTYIPDFIVWQLLEKNKLLHCCMYGMDHCRMYGVILVCLQAEDFLRPDSNCCECHSVVS